MRTLFLLCFFMLKLRDERDDPMFFLLDYDWICMVLASVATSHWVLVPMRPRSSCESELNAHFITFVGCVQDPVCRFRRKIGRLFYSVDMTLRRCGGVRLVSVL